MPTIPEAVTIAWQACRSGEFARAESVCRQVLQVVPEHAETGFLLGLAK
jgi:hypothetical protein